MKFMENTSLKKEEEEEKEGRGGETTKETGRGKEIDSSPSSPFKRLFSRRSLIFLPLPPSSLIFSFAVPWGHH